MTVQRIVKISLLSTLLAVFTVGCLSVGAVPAGSDSGSNDVVSVLDESSGDANGEMVQIEVGVEPTPVPTSFPYRNSTYGYEFSYPETWQLEELDRGAALQQGDARLIIQVWWETETNPPVRWYGMPAGDLLYRDKQSFLGETLPVQHLVYQEKVKQVLYNDGKVISAGDLQILVYLEGQGSEYEEIELPEAVIADAKMILESFRVSGLAAPAENPDPVQCAVEGQNPPADWQLYQNERYDFYLYHPRNLTIYETGEHNMEFQRENGLILRLEFRRIDQQYSLPGIIPEGEVELTRFVNYFGDENPNPIVVERSGDLITRVSVGNVFGRTTPVQFQVGIAGPTGMDIDLEQADALLEILDTLCLTAK